MGRIAVIETLHTAGLKSINTHCLTADKQNASSRHHGGRGGGMWLRAGTGQNRGKTLLPTMQAPQSRFLKHCLQVHNLVRPRATAPRKRGSSQGTRGSEMQGRGLQGAPCARSKLSVPHSKRAGESLAKRRAGGKDEAERGCCRRRESPAPPGLRGLRPGPPPLTSRRSAPVQRLLAQSGCLPWVPLPRLSGKRKMAGKDGVFRGT